MSFSGKHTISVAATAGVYAACSLGTVISSKYAVSCTQAPSSLLVFQIASTLGILALFEEARHRFSSSSKNCSCCNNGDVEQTRASENLSWSELLGQENVSHYLVVAALAVTGWLTSMQGLLSGPVTTMVVIKSMTPILIPPVTKVFDAVDTAKGRAVLPPSQTAGTAFSSLMSAAGCVFGCVLYSLPYLSGTGAGQPGAVVWHLVAALSTATNTVWIRRVQVLKQGKGRRALLPTQKSLLTNLLALPLVLLGYAVTSQAVEAPSPACWAEPAVAFAFVASCVFSSLISVTGFFAQLHLSPAPYLILVNSTRIPSILLGWLIWKESLGAPQIIGLGLWASSSFYGLWMEHQAKVSPQSVAPTISNSQNKSGVHRRALILSLSVFSAMCFLAIMQPYLPHFATWPPRDSRRLLDVRHRFGLGNSVPVPPVDGKCKDLVEVGFKEDPKYFCRDVPLKKGSCVVYDLGVQGELSFAADMSFKHGCEVHSFDPTVSFDATEWKEKTGGTFHKVGAAGIDQENPHVGPLRTLKSLMQLTGHSAVDFLKIDIESFEWNFLERAVKDGSLKGTNHIQLEAHFWNPPCFQHWVNWESEWRPKGYAKEGFDSRSCSEDHHPGSGASGEQLAKWQHVLDLLAQEGFSAVYVETGGGGQMVEFPDGKERHCCWEATLTRLVKQSTQHTSEPLENAVSLHGCQASFHSIDNRLSDSQVLFGKSTLPNFLSEKELDATFPCFSASIISCAAGSASITQRAQIPVCLDRPLQSLRALHVFPSTSSSCRSGVLSSLFEAGFEILCMPVHDDTAVNPDGKDKAKPWIKHAVELLSSFSKSQGEISGRSMQPDGLVVIIEDVNGVGSELAGSPQLLQLLAESAAQVTILTPFDSDGESSTHSQGNRLSHALIDISQLKLFAGDSFLNTASNREWSIRSFTLPLMTSPFTTKTLFGVPADPWSISRDCGDSLYADGIQNAPLRDIQPGLVLKALQKSSGITIERFASGVPGLPAKQLQNWMLCAKLSPMGCPSRIFDSPAEALRKASLFVSMGKCPMYDGLDRSLNENELTMSALMVKRRQWQNFVNSLPDSSPFQSKSRGVVFAASTMKEVAMAASNMRSMQMAGSKLQAEIFIDTDLSPKSTFKQLCTKVQNDHLGKCVFFCDTELDGGVLSFLPFCPRIHGGKYAMKLLAIALSSFSEVLWLDNDAFALKAPDYLFDSSPYIREGAMFWPWVWESSDGISHQTTHRAWLDQIALGNSASSTSETIDRDQRLQTSVLCSAQMLINKQTRYKELALAVHFNLDPFYYRFFFGDKDLFRFAWNALGTKFALGAFSGVVGYPCSSASSDKARFLFNPEVVKKFKAAQALDGSESGHVCGIQFTRNDHNNSPVFVHHLKDPRDLLKGSDGKFYSPWLIYRHVQHAEAPWSQKGGYTYLSLENGQPSLHSNGGTAVDITGDTATHFVSDDVRMQFTNIYDSFKMYYDGGSHVKVESKNPLVEEIESSGIPLAAADASLNGL